MKTSIKALASNIDNEIVEYTGLYVQAQMKLDAAYRARVRNEAEIERLSNRVGDMRRVLGKLEDVYAIYLWNRAFIVPGGHVHSSRGCRTLFADTVLYPVPECSALTEDEIVEKAADRACTVCYPSAPVDKKSTLKAPGEEEVSQRKTEREAKAAEKKAKEVRVTTGPNSEQVFGTVRSARQEVTDQLWWALYALVYNPNGTSPENREAAARSRVQKARQVMAAIAAHRDGGAAHVDALEAELILKARQKFIREGKAPEICEAWGMTVEEFTQKSKEAADKLAAF